MFQVAHLLADLMGLAGLLLAGLWVFSFIPTRRR